MTQANGEVSYADIGRFRACLEATGWGAVVVAAPENVGYLSGFYHPDMRINPERLHIVVWPAVGEPVIVVPTPRADHWVGSGDGSWIGPEESRPCIADVRPYSGEDLEMVDVVVEVLREIGLQRASIGVEVRNLPLKVADELQRCFPGVTFKDAWPLLDSVRAIKTPAERELMAAINRATAEALEQVLASAQSGDTEAEISARLAHELWLRGAHELSHGVLAAGRRSASWHPMPSRQPVTDGMMIRTDWGIRVDGYTSDIARNAVVGRASPSQRQLFARVSEAHDAIVASIRPGVIASDIAGLARREYDRLGLDYRWGMVGHSIGLVTHEAPQLIPDVEQPILENMMLEVELGYFADDEVIHIEDLVHVTAGGAVNITQPEPRVLIESSS